VVLYHGIEESDTPIFARRLDSEGRQEAPIGVTEDIGIGRREKAREGILSHPRPFYHGLHLHTPTVRILSDVDGSSSNDGPESRRANVNHHSGLQSVETGMVVDHREPRRDRQSVNLDFIFLFDRKLMDNPISMSGGQGLTERFNLMTGCLEEHVHGVSVRGGPVDVRDMTERPSFARFGGTAHGERITRASDLAGLGVDGELFAADRVPSEVLLSADFDIRAGFFRCVAHENHLTL
jgi:hypothetical protein